MPNSNRIKWSDIGGVFVGSAYIFGDQTGNARGAGALDMQSARTAVTQVASGLNSVATGIQCTASAYNSVAIGFVCTSSADYAVAIGATALANAEDASAIGFNVIASAQASSAIGSFCTASGLYSTCSGYKSLASGSSSGAIGNQCTASADYAIAIGLNAFSRIEKTTNICGPQICRKDIGEGASAAFESFCGTQIILRSIEVDLKSAATQTLTLPTGCHFFPDECGVNITAASGVVVQPTISFGITGSNAALIAGVATTALTAAFNRQRFQTLITSSGQTTLTATVTVGATATTLLGTFYFKGILIENE